MVRVERVVRVVRINILLYTVSSLVHMCNRLLRGAVMSVQEYLILQKL